MGWGFRGRSGALCDDDLRLTMRVVIELDERR
jgi:hypothetical protein